ncbi:hypothetical protein [Treponema pedis]|uniref:Uncharacterized protein n=1 Tax=Treponema pedis TaxID=409322 RepID=A0A7S6WMX9_9SPIR|nr:hypothetical protein [Treponema pedis]QOW60108.1 hypothetical protein IFE08_09670 [Treponema pedis]
MNLYEEIKSRYGNIKRTRGFYLYTEKNVRLLDMYLDGGRAILGRKNNKAALIIKQFTDKGLYSFLPTSADYNLQKALNALFPEHTEIGLYTCDREVLELMQEETGKKTYTENLWKPFLPSSESLKSRNCFFVQPPFCTSIKIAVFKKELSLKIPPSSFVSALEKAAIARSFFDLIKFIDMPQKKTTASTEKQYNKAKELCGSFWKIENIYLFPKIKETEYECFFKAALDAHILISPNFNTPSIFPDIKTYSELISFLKFKNKGECQYE